MKRTQPPRRANRHSRYLEAELLSARIAKDHARAMLSCQNPACPAPFVRWDAHHVVYEQEIRRLHLPRWNAMNVLRICIPCHDRHHDGTKWRLPLVALVDDNFTFALNVLGERALGYLTRHYAGEDPRLELLQ